MSVIQEQKTIKQHFVPQFYLKNFANDEGFVNVLDLKNRRLAKPRPYGSVCYDKYFYGIYTGEPDEISQQVEDYFKDLENKLTPIYNNFIENVLNYKKINDDELYYVAYFMSMLWIRSEYFRENMNRINSDMMKQINKRRASSTGFTDYIKQVFKEKGEKITYTEAEECRQFLLEGKYDLKFSNHEHLMFLDKIDPFANMFYGKNWQAYIVTGESQFVTSDTPITEHAPKTTSYCGAAFIERKHYLALTPKVIIELVDPKFGKKFKRKQIGDKEVLYYNGVRAGLSLKYCYSKEKNVFEEMIRIAEANNPINQLLKK
ncbi:DUF4238 domain-containing protein [Candidatus Parcubacteria bacterium]|nr:DUF4238 domain-containing protein [Candidatus Parcubacteria bacterium]